ncbi:MAG: Bax inhibitor-1 family protein [Verrucomicrobiales bacterium]
MNSQIGYANPYTVAAAQPSERALFIRRTYLHLAAAIAAFVGLEFYLFNAPWAQSLAAAMLSTSWLLVLGAFIVVSIVADRWARSDASIGKQYLGLGLFVVAEALIFLPILLLAVHSGHGDAIPQAAAVTGCLFAALTFTAFFTRKDFSFLRSFIMIGGFSALGIIVVGSLAGFTLGTWFSGAMILVAAGSILYTTSQIIHQYRPDQHVAAALSLFSSVALLFWYVLRLFMSRD